jgi:hypothetical protein
MIRGEFRALTKLFRGPPRAAPLVFPAHLALCTLTIVLFQNVDFPVPFVPDTPLSSQGPTHSAESNERVLTIGENAARAPGTLKGCA